ncbi:MAG: prolipoprotein diacylglyceryl transferase [Pseudomonadota bacterium]
MRAAIPFPEISPDIFSFTLFGMDIALRWYAMAYIGSILLGWWVVVRLVKAPTLWRDNTPPMTVKQVEDLATWVILGVVLGGRLGFVLFYQPLYYLQHPLQILQIWEGGMSFHGGLIGVVIACIWFARANRIPWISVADILCTVHPIGLFFGRIANFINAELWGRQTDMPWGVVFPGAAAQDCVGVAAGLCARHPSQLYEALLEGLILGFVLFYLALFRGGFKTPGQATAIFFIGYGLGRFLVEFVRQPDEYFVTATNPLGLAVHFDGIGLTMGQVLCVPMILVGLLILLRARGRGFAAA